MKINMARLKYAGKAMSWHFCASLGVALCVAALVFLVWFPYPYRQLAGGTELFFLVLGVDLICGPLLTFVLFNPVKSKRELVLDMSLVVIVQLIALSYGVWSVHEARPLYLVHEFDRFKVIARADLDPAELDRLPITLRPELFRGPQVVGLREISNKEREKIMFESVNGGRDYGEHPDFYAPFDAVNAPKAYLKAKPLSIFAKNHPLQEEELDKLKVSFGTEYELLRYLPVTARQDWVAILNSTGKIVGFVKGDGF